MFGVRAVCVALSLALLCAAAPAEGAKLLNLTVDLPFGNLYPGFGVHFYSTWDTQLSSVALKIFDVNGVVAPSAIQRTTTKDLFTADSQLVMSPGPFTVPNDCTFTYNPAGGPLTFYIQFNGVAAPLPATIPSVTFNYVARVNLQSVSITSTNALPNTALVGDSVKVLFFLNMPVSFSSSGATVNGKTFTASTSSPSFNVTLTRSITSADLGGASSKLATFAVLPSSFQSSLGNVCALGLCASVSQITATSDGSSVTMYSAMQPLSVVIGSNNVNRSVATTGDVVTVTFTFNQALSRSSLPPCTINGLPGTPATPSAAVYTCSRVITGVDMPTGGDARLVTFSVASSGFKSVAGVSCSAGLCSGAAISSTTSGSVIMYPVCPFETVVFSNLCNQASHTSSGKGLSVTFSSSVTSCH